MRMRKWMYRAVAGSEWSASRPGRFTPWERAPGTHWIRGWVGPWAGLDDVGRENSWPFRDSNSDPSVVQSVASRYIDYAIPIKIHKGELQYKIIPIKSCVCFYTSIPCILKTRGNWINRSRGWGQWVQGAGFSDIYTPLDVKFNER
jgi:hypothetical protein